MLDRREFMRLLVAGCLVPMSVAACSSSGGDDGGTEAEPEAEAPAEETGMGNPFLDCGSAYDAAQLAGFDVTFPESVPGCSERLYQAIQGQMVQCVYSEGDTKVIIRKGVGTDDISGDYNDYDSVETVSVGGADVTEKGDGSLVCVATWVRDDHAFAIVADAGLAPEDVEHLVQATL